MARIAGVNIPDRKHTVIALTSIYGIGRTRAAQICDAAGVPKDAKIQNLTEEEVDNIVEAVDADQVKQLMAESEVVFSF